MRKIFLIVATALTISMSMKAQSPEYKQKTRELIEQSHTSISPESMKQTMSNMLKSIAPALGKQAGQSEANDKFAAMMDGFLSEVVTPYFESGEFTNDMVECLAPLLEKEFTLDELNHIQEVYSTPEAKAFAAKGGLSLSNLTNVTQDLVQPILIIALGGDAPQIEPAQCSEAYRQTFNEYFALTGKAAIEKLKNRMGKLDSSPMAGKVNDFLTAAIPELTLKTVVNVYTIDDLKYGIRLTSDPIVQRYTTFLSNIEDDAMASMSDKFGHLSEDFMNKLKE